MNFVEQWYEEQLEIYELICAIEDKTVEGLRPLWYHVAIRWSREDCININTLSEIQSQGLRAIYYN
jgi:hypothetical protein